MLVDANHSLLNEAASALQATTAPHLREAKLRVLHLGKYYPPFHGGMETHLQGLSEQLKHDVDLKIMVANDGLRTIRDEVDGIDVTRVGKLFDLQSAPICPDLVRRIRGIMADIVHIHWPNPTAVLAYVLSGHKGRLVITYHSDIVRQRFLARAFTPVLRHALRRASAIIVTSPNYIDGSDVLPEFRDRCRVIPLGVSVKHFDHYDLEEVKQVRAWYGPRIVLGVGRLVFYKGFEHLVRAMQDIDGHLLLIGRGPLRDSLEQLAQSLKLADRVTFLSEVEDVRPYYHAADVFALSSIMRSEAFGIVQLEAMACGKPVVNTQLNSGVTFVSPHGVSGLTVPPGDSRALARAINQLLDQPQLRVELGGRARQRVAQNFTISKMVQRTSELYQEVMGIQSDAAADSGTGVSPVLEESKSEAQRA
jgi:rhamnosyl/mannosyltransferase